MKIKDVDFVVGAVAWDDLPWDGKPEVAFMGRSNVGKSSLINLLVGRKRLAYTSKTPGKTRELNFFRVNNDFYLVDLPGYGYAKVARTQKEEWAAFLSAYLVEREPLAAVVHLIDSRHPPTELDEQAMDMLAHSGADYIVALTKVDKLSGQALRNQIEDVQRVMARHGRVGRVVPTSALKKEGKRELWAAVREALERR